jgi:hypothetical protein
MKFKYNLLLTLIFYLSIMFGMDIMDFYNITEGINIIKSEVNREFIIWFGFIVTSINIYNYTMKI